MLMELTAWGKVRNSTALPPESTYTAKYEMNYKAPEDLLAPHIVIDVNAVDVPWYHDATSFRYVRITISDKVTRHYFIEDVTFNGCLLVFTLSADILGDQQESIKSLRPWVTRAYYTGLDGANNTLYDSYITMTGARQFFVQPVQTRIACDYDTGFYTVGIINNDDNQIGAVTYYAFTGNGFKQFCTQVFGTGNYAGVDGSQIDIATFRAIFNPMQYITGVVYIPQTLQEIQKASEELTSLSFGWYKINNISQCWRLNVGVSGLSGYVDAYKIQKHPQYKNGIDNETINIDPYMQISLQFPPYGNIALDTTIFMQYEFIKLYNTIDPVTGMGTLEIYASHGGRGEIEEGDIWCGQYQSLVGIDVTLSQVTRDKYAINTAVTAKNAGVLNAMYNQSIGDIIMSAIVTGQDTLEPIGAAADSAYKRAVDAASSLNAKNVGSGWDRYQNLQKARAAKEEQMNAERNKAIARAASADLSGIVNGYNEPVKKTYEPIDILSMSNGSSLAQLAQANAQDVASGGKGEIMSSYIRGVNNSLANIAKNAGSAYNPTNPTFATQAGDEYAQNPAMFSEIVENASNALSNFVQPVVDYARGMLKNVGRTPRVQANIAAANAAGVEAIVKAQQPQVTTLNMGAQTVTAYKYGARIIYSYYNVIVPDYEHIGYPVADFRRLRECWGGFVLCSNVTFIPGQFSTLLPTEREYIISSLQTGVFLQD